MCTDPIRQNCQGCPLYPESVGGQIKRLAGKEARGMVFVLVSSPEFADALPAGATVRIWNEIGMGEGSAESVEEALARALARLPPVSGPS